MSSAKKQLIATVIAIVFHVIGFVGILINKERMAPATSFNLLLMLSLVLFTHEKLNVAFWIFFASCFTIGIAAEYIGTSTGFLFGDYSYGNNLGIAVKNVPLIIGVNWFLVIYCCAVTMHFIIQKLSIASGGEVSQNVKFMSLVIDGAMLAVFFDWLIEPVAINLEYWKWEGEIPALNYITWFLISVLLLMIFRMLKLPAINKFGVNLLLIQMMFFLLLRTFL